MIAMALNWTCVTGERGEEEIGVGPGSRGRNSDVTLCGLGITFKLAKIEVSVLFFFLKKEKFLYLFMAVLGLPWVFAATCGLLVATSGGYPLVAVCGLLITAASLVAEHGL